MNLSLPSLIELSNSSARWDEDDFRNNPVAKKIEKHHAMRGELDNCEELFRMLTNARRYGGDLASTRRSRATFLSSADLAQPTPKCQSYLEVARPTAEWSADTRGRARRGKYESQSYSHNWEGSALHVRIRRADPPIAGGLLCHVCSYFPLSAQFSFTITMHIIKCPRLKSQCAMLTSTFPIAFSMFYCTFSSQFSIFTLLAMVN